MENVFSIVHPYLLELTENNPIYLFQIGNSVTGGICSLFVEVHSTMYVLIFLNLGRQP